MILKHNEDTRVKIPAILHLTRLGYNYISVSDALSRWHYKATKLVMYKFNELCKEHRISFKDDEGVTIE